nr:MAG TPA: cysteine-rich protein [Caudoviricetes sp.]
MQSQGFSGKLTVKDGFLQCPVCRQNKKVHRIDEDTKGVNIPVFCRFCKWELRIDISAGQCFPSRSQR